MLTIRDVTKLIQAEKVETENQFFNTLTSTVTHEMMTPINCIITFARAITNSEKSQAIINVATLLKLNLKDLLDRS